jgi:hypothetical protein
MEEFATATDFTAEQSFGVPVLAAQATSKKHAENMKCLLSISGQSADTEKILEQNKIIYFLMAF